MIIKIPCCVILNHEGRGSGGSGRSREGKRGGRSILKFDNVVIFALYVERLPMLAVALSLLFSTYFLVFLLKLSKQCEPVSH